MLYEVITQQAADRVAVGVGGQQHPHLPVGGELAPLIGVQTGEVAHAEAEVVGPLERRWLTRLGTAAEIERLPGRGRRQRRHAGRLASYNFV